jgi:hypothetical protein
MESDTEKRPLFLVVHDHPQRFSSLHHERVHLSRGERIVHAFVEKLSELSELVSREILIKETRKLLFLSAEIATAKRYAVEVWEMWQ